MRAGSRPSPWGLIFAGVIGWSAFLLFSVEPLVGRLVLPVFGGAPAVWATILFFFQGVLVLGYLYGHLSVTRLGVRRGAILHLGLLLVAGAALALAPARVADLYDATLPDVANLVGMLAVTIGLPAFVLTTTTPLISGWFAASRPAGDGAGAAAGDAYWLYALSNTGSLLALLSYPFLIEPRLGLSEQRGVWAIAFSAFAVLVGCCAVWAARRTPAPGEKDATGGSDADPDARVWRQRGGWLLLAAVPSGLLSAVTTFIATDLVSAPLLWLVPLAIYLVTFIVAFSERGRRIVPLAVGLLPAAVTLMWVPTGVTGGWPILPLVLIAYGGLAIVATALHGRLAMARPAPSRLTEFYLVISIGGALASAFVALLAPVVFPGIWELPILLVLALVALAISESRPRATSPPPRRGRRLDLSAFVRGARGRLGPYLVVAVVLAAVLVRDQSIVAEAGVRWLLLGGLLLLVGGRPGILAVSTAVVLALAVLVPQPATIFRDRSFFGVTEVSRSPAVPYTILANGTTTHGIQSTDPARARVPLAYYTQRGPFGDLFALLRSAGRDQAVAAIGLGAGAVAAYLERGWSMTFFEIDPVVAAVAADPALFTYLSSAVERPGVVLGDARLSLRSVAAGAYDAVIVDAFSSDAIPTHLLTTEAIAEYVRVAKPGGPILVHITNRYYDLAPAVAAAGRANGLDAHQRVYLPADVEAQAGASITVAIVLIPPASTAATAGLAAAGWQPVNAVVTPLTDDFMDVLRFLKPLW